MYRVSSFVGLFALALIAGVALATLWVNLAPDTYYDAIEFRLLDLSLPDWAFGMDVTVTPLSLVSDGLMAVFLAFIGKELWEAVVLERGALSGRAKASMPLGAVLGGLAGAAVAWLICSALFVRVEEADFLTGWTVPLGSDVILCYVMGRLVFGRNHPALHLLLLITIAFDILGLLIAGMTNPQAVIRPLWLILPAVTLAVTWFGFGRMARPSATERQHRRAHALWPYVVAGVLIWTGMALSGLPATLGLLPLIPVIPHAERSFGLFAEAEEYLTDPLNRLAHHLARPLPWIMFLFGLTRGGVDVLALAPTTGSVLAALWLGKPLGIFAGALIAGAVSGTLLPRDTRLTDLLLIAIIAGIGFTVPVLTVGIALPGGRLAEAARLGLVLSLLAGPAAMGLARLLGLQRQT
ncbi:MAG: Na+/H+ antiporter NhaA [Candidatus Saccharibacteria bacterium]|nr:Na+/H+ antiporter NhaA [Pseudorhodobacter sp.]